jgi:ligand-binding sensor domain-containing protein
MEIEEVIRKRKRAFWKSELFWFATVSLLAGSYYLLVKLEEIAYDNFINREWPTRTLTYTEVNSPLVGEYINNLTADSSGRVWIGTDSALNVVSPDGSWTTYLIDGKGMPVQSVAIDELERIWVGTFDGLYILNPNGQWILYAEKSKTVWESYNSSAILVDRLDRVWVANNEGLRVFLPDGTKVFYTTENSGLPDDYITALAEDRQGNVWIGTRTKGVVVADQYGQWRTFKANGTINGIFENWVTALFIDDQDRVWIGTREGGISMLSPDGTWTTYNTYLHGIQSDPLYDDKEINAFAMDEQGRLWIGTWDALFALDVEGNWLAYTQANSALNPDYVRALTVDTSNRLWIATFHEIIILDLNKPLPKSVSNEWIRLRNVMLIPAGMIKAAKWFLFAPAELFDSYSAGVCSASYLTLLALMLPAIFGMFWGNKIKNQNLLKSSRLILLIAFLGVVGFWILAFLMAMFIYRD